MDKEEINSGRVLGLDVSTKTIGICLFDADGKLLGIETEDGKVHILKTSQQLYKFLKKL